MTARQINALRQQQAWIEQWIADHEAGLKPTIESLISARAALAALLSQGEAS